MRACLQTTVISLHGTRMRDVETTSTIACTSEEPMALD